MMSFTKLPSVFRRSAVRKPASKWAKRGLHTTSAPRASILFALGALSNSRETQHFNKISRLPRVEHSPPLKLIKTGEVDPFSLTAPAKATPAHRRHDTVSPLRVWNDRALQIGRALLADEERRREGLHRALAK